ncbi:MAG: hypothetical protein L3J79_11850 [Candidatus Marinimicrobia bacterium]|nr:hypothetical protein [Candidatus Neomarinimicrobiota bacterium]
MEATAVDMMSLTGYRQLALMSLWTGWIATVGLIFSFVPNLELVLLSAFLGGVALGPKRGLIVAVVGEAIIALPLEGLIDLDAERARIGKEIAKVEIEVKKIDGKLANKNFTDRAPAAVVEEQHTRREAFTAELEKLKSALDNLPE